MVLPEINIHLMANEIPEVKIQKFSDFYAVNIGSNLQLGVKFFLYSPQQVTNFKNSLLWAFEKPIKITE